MRALKTQYFLTFVVMGSLLPFLPVYLREQGLSQVQVGRVLGMSGFAIIVSPVLVTLLADARFQNRSLLAAAFGGAGLMLAALLGAGGQWAILAVYLAHALAFVPIPALQDGLTFGVQAQHRERGLPEPAYHRIRIYGTFGFIVPSILLYFLLRETDATWLAVAVSSVACGVGVLNALTLPKLDRSATKRDPAAPVRRTLPTLTALKRVLQPRMAAFFVAMWLVHLAIGSYYGFYSIYLTELLGISREWVGLIAIVGVVIEIPFMLAFGKLMERLGARRLMVAGSVSMALRFAMLALWPSLGVALFSQVFHGITVLVVHVAPPNLLNQKAEAGYRSSMQGLYAMLVFGTGRVAGNFIAGEIAASSVLGVFAFGAALCVVATPIVAWALGGSRGARD